jgi:hypothetical protein
MSVLYARRTSRTTQRWEDADCPLLEMVVVVEAQPRNKPLRRKSAAFLFRPVNLLIAI